MTERERFEKLCENKYLTRAEKNIAWEAWQDAKRWIPVEEELPETNILVLGYNAKGISSDERSPVVCFLEEDGKWYEPWKPWKEYGVTHWQPLPPPPEEEEDE